MKRIFFIAIGLVAALLCLSGCTSISRVANEQQLQEMLVEHEPECIVRYIGGENLTLAIEKCEIVRRQTNKDEKKDKVDIKLSVYTDDYVGELYYTLHLDYYDEGGWQLDDYEVNASESFKAKGNTVPKELIEREVERLKAAYGKCDFISESFDEETGTLYQIYNVDCDAKYLKATGDVTLKYKLGFRDPDPDWQWVVEEQNGVEQKWQLPESVWYIEGDVAMTLNGLPRVLVQGERSSDGKVKGFDGIDIIDITDNEITVGVYVITEIRDGGWLDDRSAEWERFTLDLTQSEREIKVCENHSTGSYLGIRLDPEIGFALVKDGGYRGAFLPQG